MKAAGNRFLLRDATGRDHEVLDAMVGHFGDERSYIRYLEGMASFRGNVEPALRGLTFPATFGAWRPTCIFDELAADLADLHQPAPEPAGDFGAPDDAESLLGILYVLEGSSLGARVLARRASALGYTAEHGARHLAAQTSNPGTWQEFVKILDGLDPAGMERAVDGARRTFSAAIDAFGGPRQRERAG